ncbi:hypothetical protein C8J57DRAFT_1531352 [Mycena rebaudengoi]|nr:hypothetical protein C8J57DRAFT_1531352 [Mycena rebaudengoi]
MLKREPTGSKCPLPLTFCLRVLLSLESAHRTAITFSPPAPAGIDEDGADPKSAILRASSFIQYNGGFFVTAAVRVERAVALTRQLWEMKRTTSSYQAGMGTVATVGLAICTFLQGPSLESPMSSYHDALAATATVSKHRAPIVFDDQHDEQHPVPRRLVPRRPYPRWSTRAAMSSTIILSSHTSSSTASSTPAYSTLSPSSGAEWVKRLTRDRFPQYSVNHFGNITH